MKPYISSNFRSASPTSHKANQMRSSAFKFTTHRYERRKVREYLRFGGDAEEVATRFERFG